MKKCKCEDSHIWYGMRVHLDTNNIFYQTCPDCGGRIEAEEFDKKKCDEIYKKMGQRE